MSLIFSCEILHVTYNITCGINMNIFNFSKTYKICLQICHPKLQHTHSTGKPATVNYNIKICMI